MNATGNHRRVRLMLHAPVLIGLATACTPSPSPLPWTIDFADGAPAPPEVTAVRAWIRAGGCESGEMVYSVVITSGAMAMEPPHLDDGTWGFGADALDAECRIVARACEDVVVPTASQVALLLEALDPPSAGCTAPAVCEAGACVGGADAGLTDGGAADASVRDAGPRDAGHDSGPPDAGARDSGPPDAGARDSGPTCASTETACTDEDDDDCDGMIDCADPDCAGQTCAGGRCGGGVCCSTCVTAAGVCVASTSWSQCGDHGEACVRCADCVDCRSGRCTGSVSAGTACTGGTCIGTTTLTCCTGCVSGSASTGTCQTGTTSTACGDGGDSCVSCGAGQVCTERQECCGGCTASTGACRVGTSRLNCGTGGAECTNCGAGNSCCPAASGVGGVCVAGLTCPP